jgi:hypothetical protein
MLHHVMKHVRVVFNREIKTPASRHAGLPDAFRFIVLLGVQRRMVEVVE